MKVVSQDGGLATLALIPDEVKPLKGFSLPHLLTAIAARYAVARAPTLDEARTTGAKFQNGVFRTENREIVINELGLYNDALSVSTTDTADSELVLDDLLGWLKEEFKFRDQTIPPIRLYQSDLVLRFDNDPAEAFGSIASFIEFIQGQMTPPNARSKKPVEFSAIMFGADPAGAGPTPEFTVARRLNVPWHLGLYFSKAHMRTDAHIRALELLDGLIAKRR